MATLLSIYSQGHSGSTLLDLLAGSIPGVFSCGELQYLPWQLYRNGQANGGIQKQDICTCLNSFKKCSVWREVIDSVSQDVGYEISKNPLRFRMAFFRPQAYQKEMPRHRLLIKRIYHRTMMANAIRLIPWLLRASAYPTTRRNWQLIDALADVTDSHTIVDSSKDLERFHILHAYFPEKTALIVLARDVRRIASSYIKWKGDPIKAAKGWSRYYTEVLKFMKLNPKIRMMFIWYEDMCENPERIRHKIADFLRIPPPRPMEAEIDTRTYHMVAGNPSRYRGKVVIKVDDSWQSRIKDEHLLSHLEALSSNMTTVFNNLQQISE